MENTAQLVATLPRIGEKAPSFKAVTTQGEINFPEQYKGSWVILFSHPADFTPVCTSEFMTFASMEKQFAELNCKLVGLSVDGLYSHIAWLRTIKDKIEYKGMKDVEVKFPLIEDITMEVAKLYGMIQPGESNTKAVRAVFVIDPEGIIRTMIYYPLSMGRNFDELLRVVQALKTADEFSVATPADWRPGDDVIVPTGFLRCRERAHGSEGPQVLRLVLLYEGARQGHRPQGNQEVTATKIVEKKAAARLPFSCHLYIKPSRTRTVELAEVNALPGSQQEPPTRHDNLFARADRARFEVRGGISFSMPELRPIGIGLREGKEQITHHVGVGVFIDSNRRGSVRTEDRTHTVRNAAVADRFCDLPGDIHKILPGGRKRKLAYGH